MRKQRRRNEDETEVDMTPMLDIVFIMLIFFIVTTSFVKEDAIVLDRPSANPPENQPDNPKRPIMISISETSEVTIGGRIVDPNAIRANVESARADKPNALVVVQADEASKTWVVVTAVDQAREAGAEKVTVVKPPKS